MSATNRSRRRKSRPTTTPQQTPASVFHIERKQESAGPNRSTPAAKRRNQGKKELREGRRPWQQKLRQALECGSESARSVPDCAVLDPAHSPPGLPACPEFSRPNKEPGSLYLSNTRS